ncbi:hippurate hydrolase [Kineosphaera limosa]|uniref:Putative hydrolase n=1 Tax=Kineosphaera limosa NBRC 100340 TaxID=1184609 RepID=K6VKG3_9MICO|nr:M20 family metallopeptidase [Kineosphaera limosa]NYE01556.1 hippurate hydrolase [Kineosphaera limosa]GAB96713.1 putative hydrolase [Kineosphaera limosa NBRC 100340]
MGLVDDAHDIHDELVDFRRDLHRHPEIGLDLPRTQERVLAALEPLGLEVSTGERLTSVTAVLRGGRRDAATPRAVLLRADMDALPVQELTGVDYSSQIDGVMHACGHDLHTAMLVGAAKLLHARRDELPGDVVFMFQPGEEGFHGGEIMVEEGVLDAAGPRVEAAYGMHVFAANDPGGVFITKPGPMLAAVDEAVITVHGRGGHGSAPVHALDPVPIAAEIILATNVALTRQFSVFDPVVVTFGVMRAGTKSNIIPDDARLEATMRSFSDEHRARLREVIERVATGVAQAHGATAEVLIDVGYPVTVNEDGETEFAASVARELFGDDRHVRWVDPLSGAEDFSYVLEQVPGSFVGLSAVPPGVDPATADTNHSPRATFDDSVLADGAALYAGLALSRLTR